MYFKLCNDYLVVKLFWFAVLGRSQIVIDTKLVES